MNKILISALLLTAGYAFGQMEIGWDSSNLKKKVKSIKETMYYLPTEDMGGVKQEISNLERKRITYTLEGENEMIIYHDENDKIIEKRPLPQNKILRGRILYEEPRGFIDNYDDKGNIVETIYLSQNPDIVAKSYYKYDDKGNIIEQILDDIVEEPLYRRFVFKYDSKGNRIKDIVYNKEGKKIDQIRYKYNKYNDIVKKKYYKTSFQYRYKYDEKNNWIERISLKQNKPFILDGYPRTLDQADFLKSLEAKNINIDQVILLEITPEQIISRLEKRRICPNCKTIYHMQYNPPKDYIHCNNESCQNVEVIKRADDNPEIIKNRIKIYEQQTSMLINYYEKANILIKLNSYRPIDEIVKDTSKELGI